MQRNEISAIAQGEFLRLTEQTKDFESLSVVHRPINEDEIDRIGKQIVFRLLEAGVIEPL